MKNININKLKTTALIGAISYAAVMIAPLSALAVVSPPTYITGKVYQGDPNNGVAGVNVAVKCKNANQQNVTTDAQGVYYAQYTEAQCDAGDTASATVNGVTKTAVVSGTQAFIGFDLGVINVPYAVPEFGLITGAVAALGTLGAYFGLKRGKLFGK